MSNTTFIFENDAGQTITIDDGKDVDNRLLTTISSLQGLWNLYRLEDEQRTLITPIKSCPRTHAPYVQRNPKSARTPKGGNMFTGIDTSIYTVAQLAQMLGKKKNTIASRLHNYGLPYVRIRAQYQKR